MTPELLTAILSFSGMVIGSVSGIVISAKLTKFRLEQLEKKVDKHNHLVERMYCVESDIKVLCQRMEDMEAN